MDFFFLFLENNISLFLGGICLLYLLSVGLSFSRFQWSAKGMFGLAFLLTIGVVGCNWLSCGHPPLGNMYHVLTVLSACFFPIWLCLRRDFAWLLPYFAFAAAFALFGTLFMNPSLEWQRIPALQSAWFVPHVLAYMIAYALAFLAFILAIQSLWRKNRDIEQSSMYRNGYEQATHRIIRWAVPFMTFGLFSGALWADKAWGVYWSWDPKEVWALITWFLYLGYLHAVHSKTWRGRRATLLLIGAFVMLLVTFFVVNLLPKFSPGSLHSYT